MIFKLNRKATNRFLYGSKRYSYNNLKGPEPKTLVRLGRFDLSLEEAVKRCAIKLTKAGMLLGNTVRYATFQEHPQNYLLMVSQQIDRIVSGGGHNTMLTVTSYHPLLNNEVADRFEGETGLYLNLAVPDSYRELIQPGIGISFRLIERNPVMAMAILRGDIQPEDIGKDYSTN